MVGSTGIVVNSKFRPLTYDELATPLREATNQHIATETSLMDIQNQLADIEHYINNNPNSEAAQRYQSYMDELDRQVQTLSSSGLNPQTRADLLNLRREYTNIVRPIKNGIALYQKAIAKRNKDYNKGIIGPDITPEDFIYNPNYEDTYLLGTNIYTDVKNLFKNLTGFNNKPRQYNNGISIITEIPQGYSSEEIQTLFADEENPNLTQELKDTWKLIKNKYGFNTLTPEQKEQFIYYALQGALSGTKPPKYTTRNIPKQKKTTSTDNQSGRTSIGDDAEGLD